MRFPEHMVPAWCRRHGRPNYVAAQYLGRARDSEDRRRVRLIYARAKRLRAAGLDVVVDHIEPLCSDWVCGLGHSANLQIIDRQANVRKTNGQRHPDLFSEPEQMELWQ